MASGVNAGEPEIALVTIRKSGILCKLASLLFGGRASYEFVATRVHIEASPESIWRDIAFYEEVPGKPPILLACFLLPLGTEGEKSRQGALIVCRYRQGSLVKRITALDKPYLIRFDVLDQHLGIEHCAIARSGSYSIRRAAAGSEVVLTTSYRGFLHPRWFWRPLERLGLHQLHSHILNGMRKMISAEHPLAGEQLAAGCICRKEQS